MKILNSAKKDNLSNFNNLVDLLNYRGETQTDSLAYVFLQDGESESKTLTYGQLHQKAKNIAAKLLLLKVNDSRALLLYPQGLEFITAFFGCLYAGVIAVPVRPPSQHKQIERLRNIISDAKTNTILTTQSLFAELQSFVNLNQVLADMQWLTTDNLDIQLDIVWEKPIITEDTLAFCQYTSGSTNIPKGVMISHGNILNNEKAIKQSFGHDQETIGLGWLPHYHDMGLIGNILQGFYIGRPCVLMSPLHFVQQPFRWLKAISQYRVTSSGGPNFAYDLSVRKIKPDQRAELDLSSWKVAFIGAEPIRSETLADFEKKFAPCGFNAKAFHPCYGMAEATLFITGGTTNEFPVLKQVSDGDLRQNRVVTLNDSLKQTRTLVGCGRTWLEQEILIVDPESSVACLPDQIGEVWVKGLSVAKGYWNQREQTEETFLAYLANNMDGPFLRTGDLGFIDNGTLFITGRLKDLIIIRGQNYYPHDLELTVEKSAVGLRPCSGAAFGIDIDGNEQLVIAQEIERTFLKKINFDEVVGKICKKIIEDYNLRVYAIALIKPSTIPKTSSGKIKRYACKQDFLENRLDIIYSWSEKSLLLSRK